MLYYLKLGQRETRAKRSNLSFIGNISETATIKFLALGKYFVHTLQVYVCHDILENLQYNTT